jgi:hypothetical protein
MTDVHSKLGLIAAEIGPINKDEKNREQGYSFRSIETIVEKARPLFARERISTAPNLVSLEHGEVVSKGGAKGWRAIVVMSYTFTAASDGSSMVVSMPGEAIDYGDKSTSKACQMAYKYALIQALQIGSGEADPDSHTPEQVVRPPNPLIVAKEQLLAAVDGNKDKAKEIWKAAEELGKSTGAETPEEILDIARTMT